MAQLIMKRPAGGVRPASDIPVRTAGGADAEGLGRLLGRAFPEMEWSAARARNDLLDAADVTATFVAESDGIIVATASSRHFDLRFPEAGYVHWVGVDPELRGEGYFDAVMAAVIDQFARENRPLAVLETDDIRLPAISAYLRIGFIPTYPWIDHEERWSAIFALLAEARRARRNG